jgi:hypothetical protein
MPFKSQAQRRKFAELPDHRQDLQRDLRRVESLDGRSEAPGARQAKGPAEIQGQEEGHVQAQGEVIPRDTS